MTTLVTNFFKQDLAQHFINSVSNTESVYYLMASRHIPFEDDNSPPTPNNSLQETHYDVFEQGIFCKRVTSSDINYMADKVVWSTNTVYNMYDDRDGSLYTEPFYVVVDGGANYNVYKVLNNNNGAPSIVKPKSTLATAPSFTTSDGYVWKYMYSLPESTFEKFQTSSKMPVVISSNVSGNTVGGALDVINIDYAGSNYVSTLSGIFKVDDVREVIPISGANTLTYRLANTASSNNDFYVGSAIYISSGTGSGQIRRIVDYDGSTRVATINATFTTPPVATSQYLVAPLVTVSGDGTSAVGYANVASNSSVSSFISSINIVNRGINYTYATAAITGNTGNISNSAIVRPILPPPGGHGKNPIEELNAKNIGLSVNFNTNESGYIPATNDFRKFILLENPLVDDVTFTLDTDSIDGSFTVGETINQIDYKTLIGSASSTLNGNTITGTSSEYNNSLKVGDYVYILDSISNNSVLRVVASVTNSSEFAVTVKMPFTSSSVKVAHANVIARAVKQGNTNPYVTCTNTEPKFVSGKIIIGSSSGSRGNVTSISVGEKPFNSWNTLDNRTRIRYNVYNGGMANDAILVQDGDATANARFYSSNGTFVFFTINKGIRAVDNSRIANSSSYFDLDNIIYGPDIVKNSCRALYIENESPISRSLTTSETFKLVIQL